MIDDPEVTIEPADNGYIVRHYQRSTKKDEGGRTIRRVASTSEEALRHAGAVLGAGTRSKKKTRDGHVGASAAEAGEQSSSPAAHGARSHSRRRRPRASGRR